ncbi:MAG: ABC transporter permease [Planctomycetes bacterium]|nr:ABC transporter permease [Planctomycetota bacterium]
MNALFFATAKKDVRERLRDPAALALWLGIPIVIGTLMSLGMGGASGPKPKAPLYVVDHDDSLLSGAVAKAFEQGPFGDLFAVSSPTEQEARAKLADDDGSALIVIPSGFGDALLEDEPTELVLVKNPSQRILPGIVEEALALLPEFVFHVNQLVGPELRARFEAIDDDGPDEAEVVAISLDIRREIARIEEFVFPPVIELSTEAEASTSSTPGFSFGSAFFPSLLFMSLIFLAHGFAEDLWKEKRQGTLRRVVASPHGLAAFLGGKLLGTLCVTVPIAALGLGLGWALFDLPGARLGLAFLWLVLGMALFWCLFALVQVTSSSERGANVVGNMILFPLLMLGGTFFPFEVMPAWMASIGRWTPNGWTLTQFRAFVDGTSSLGAGALAFGVLLAVLAATFAIATHWLSKRFVRI